MFSLLISTNSNEEQYRQNLKGKQPNNNFNNMQPLPIIQQEQANKNNE